MRRALVPLLLLLALAACSPSASVRRGRTGGGSLDAFCEVTSTPGLVRFDGEVATVCEGDSCMVARVRDGALSPVPVSGARMGLGVSRGRTVVLHDDGRLTIVEGSDEIELAAWAADVSVEDDGDHVLFVGLLEADTTFGEDVEDPETGESTAVTTDAAAPSPAMGTRLVRMDLDTAELEEIVVDPMAGTPIALPGSDDILYVGAPDGVAALMRVSPGGAPRQLTNVGVTEVGMEFVPVPLYEIAFSGNRIVYAVLDGSVDASEIDGPVPGAMWAVDVDSGEAELLGGGRFPLADADGVTAVVDDTPGGGCASTYARTEGP